jgi:hypothetical protein
MRKRKIKKYKRKGTDRQVNMNDTQKACYEMENLLKKSVRVVVFHCMNILLGIVSGGGTW